MNIMKEAHKLTKEIKIEYPNVNYKFQLGICITYLSKNKGEIEMVELKGTEKQIAWANEIRESLLSQMEEYKEKVADKRVTKQTVIRDFKEKVLAHNPELKTVKEYREELIKMIDAGIESLKNETDSKKFIDIKQGSKCYGMYFEDVLKELI